MNIKIIQGSIIIEYHYLDSEGFFSQLIKLQNDYDFRILQTEYVIILIFRDFLVEVPHSIIKSSTYNGSTASMTLEKKLFPWSFSYDLKNNIAVFRSIYELFDISFYEHVLISLYANRYINTVYYNGDYFTCVTCDGTAFSFKITRNHLEEMSLTRGMFIQCK